MEQAPRPHRPDLTSLWEERRWHYRRSLASRVILLTTIAVGLAVAFVALGAFVTVRSQLQATLDESLLERAKLAAQRPTLSQLTKYRVPSWALGAADVRIIFITADREWRSVDQGPTLGLGEPELQVADGELPHSLRTIAADGVRYRVAAVPAGTGQALVVAQSMRPQEKTLARLGVVMLIFGGAGVIAAGLAGWGVARHGLRPVRRLTASVERIAETQDLTPLEVEGGDEIARLATAFNQMLTEIAASNNRQRRLVADAGHELRTPLTSLRTNIDLLTQADLEGGLPLEARRELLADVRAQTEELTTLIGDLVELSRDEPVTSVEEEVDLADVLHRAVGRVRRRAPDLTFDVTAQSWSVTGEAASLERAVTNVLDNAAKWSPEHGTVTVTLTDGVLTVDDEGSGFATEDLPHVFERFYRSRESRSMPGSGLGLSIVRQVADRHGGSAEATASPCGGARVVLTIPGTPLPEPAAGTASSPDHSS